MSKKLYSLLTFEMVKSIVTTFIMLFVNLYIWQENQELVDLALFNIFIYIFNGLAYTLGSYLFYKTSLRFILNIGSVFSVILFYIISFITYENHLLWIITTGSLFGLFKGLHASGIFQALSVSGEAKEFSVYFHQRALWAKVVNIGSPIILGIIILKYSYQVSFIVMLVLSLVLVLLSFIMPKMKPQIDSDTKQLFTDISIKKVFRKNKHKKLPLSYLSGGVFSEFQTIFLVFFTFTITTNQLGVAFINGLYALLTVLSIWLYRKLRVRDKQWLYVGIILAFSGFILAMVLENWWLLIATLLLEFSNFCYRTTFFSHHFEAIDGEKIGNKFKINIWRENLTGFARVVFLFWIVALNYYFETMEYIGFVMAGTLIITLFIPRIHRSFELKNF